MGCDIHTFIEYSDFTDQNGEPYWSSLGGQINAGRDYTMFGLLAGVRGGEALFSPRGLPNGKHSYTVEDYMHVRIGTKEQVENSYEGGVVTLETAQGWRGETIINTLDGKPWKVTNPDLHSHSWLTRNELQLVLARYRLGTSAEELDVTEENRAIVFEAAAALRGGGERYSASWDAIVAAMSAFEGRGCQTRLIFCFDN